MPLAAVGGLVGRALGCRFEPYQNDPSDLFCCLLSLETSLSEHSLESDGDLDLASTRFQLDTRTPSSDGDLRDIQLGLMAAVPTLLYRRAGISSGLLVYDVQRLLARYELREGRFVDVVSGLPVVFPAHFHHVFSRAKEAEPCAAPNGGPATQLGNSGATEGPPSVS